MAFFFLVLIFFTLTTTSTIATKTNDNQKPKVVQKHFLGVDPLSSTNTPLMTMTMKKNSRATTGKQSSILQK
jgi:hypothetical protein